MLKKACWLIDLVKSKCSKNVWCFSWKYTFDLRLRRKPVFGEGWFSRIGFAGDWFARTFKVPTTPWKSSKSHRLSQFSLNCLLVRRSCWKKEDENSLTMFAAHTASHSAAPQHLGFCWFYLPWKLRLHWDVSDSSLPAGLWSPRHQATYSLHPWHLHQWPGI